MSVDYKWANAVMDQLKGCQAENARLREEAAAMTTALQKVEHLESELASIRLTDAERSLLEMLADHPVTHEIMPNEVATLRGLLERLGGGK